MGNAALAAEAVQSGPALRTTMRKYQTASLSRAVWQLVNSVVPYVLIWYGMYRALEYSYLLVLPLALLATGFVTRIFIIQHDCGHGSFFRSSLANDVVGTLCGVLTFTPYHFWRHNHAVHHATSGRLDRRGTGDFNTLTVDEYRDARPFRRFLYRLYRHPVVLLGVEGLFLFLVIHRFSRSREFNRERWSVIGTNLALIAVAVGLGSVMGFKAYVLIQLTTLYFMSIVGVWLFYVQHQFEETYWERDGVWDFAEAAVQGSSYYKLPKVLQWFTGNIGLHHIHHLNARIANYHLQRCHDDTAPDLRFHTLTLRGSLKTLRLRLWDENRGRLIGFRELKRQGSPENGRLIPGHGPRGTGPDAAVAPEGAPQG